MDRAKIFNQMMPAEFVEFDLNPSALRVSKTSRNAARGSASAGTGTPAGSTASTFREARSTELSGKAMLTGEDTKRRADQLLAWLQPGGGLLGQIGAAAVGAVASALGGRVNLTTKQPTLIFQWGPPMMGFVMECILTSCSVDFTRFESSGVPVRADVSFTLTEQPSLLSVLPTNPTSGGPPGRSRHVVVGGENLATVANDRYGSPARWRAVAEANGIDDPLRVRPGTPLRLPAPHEAGAPTEGGAR